MWHDSFICHTYLWKSHVTHMYEGVMSHISMRESCHTYLWHVTSHISMTRLLIRVTWLLYISHISMKESCHTYVWRSHVTHIYNTTPHTCDMTPLYACHVPNYFARAPPFIDDDAPLTYEEVMSYMWRSHVTHMNESCHTYEGVVS